MEQRASYGIERLCWNNDFILDKSASSIYNTYNTHLKVYVNKNDASDTKRYIRTSFSETCVFVTCKVAKGGLQ